MQRIQNKRLSSDSQSSTTGLNNSRKKKSTAQLTENDRYCWICHRDGVVIRCEFCPRSFHLKCCSDASTDDWLCPECEIVMKAENLDTRSIAMRSLTVDQLSSLLKFSIIRLKLHCPEEFQKSVPLDEFPNYPDFVIHPMDLETLENNIKKRVYGCTESFLADVKWILHNCIVFNGYQHKLTGIAKNLVKVCKHEMNEIEVCPDCYFNAYTKRDNWFQEPCCPPHLLIWAKLKGFPFWPAKAMKIASGMVDVRFFGAHDRAWIPVSQCFLLSSNPPATMKMKVKRKGVFEQSMEELAGHIVKLKENYNAFQYSPSRTSIQSEDLLPHVETMLPGVNVRELRSSFMLDRSIQPRFYCSEKAVKSENIEDDDMQSYAMQIDCAASHNSLVDVDERSKVRLESIKNLEYAIEKIKAIGKEGDGSGSESSAPSSDWKAESTAGDHQKAEENVIRIHLKRAEIVSDSKKQVWESKSEIELKDTGDHLEDSKRVVEDLLQRFENEEEQQKGVDKIDDLLKTDSPTDNRGEIDVDIGDALNSFLEEEHNDAETVHVQLAKTTHSEAVSPTVTSDEPQECKMDEESIGKNNEEDEILAGADMSQPERTNTYDYSDDSTFPETEGDLVIDLDRDNLNLVKENKRVSNRKSNRKIPYGKLKPKSNPSSGRKQVIRAVENDRSFNEKKSESVTSHPRIFTMLPKLIVKSHNSPPNRHLNNSGGSSVDRIPPKLYPRPHSAKTQVVQGMTGENNVAKYSKKMMDLMHGTMEEMFRELANSGNSDQANVQLLQLEMEKMRWLHNQELVELKHNNDLVLLEMRNSMEYEQQRAIADVISQCQLEKQKAIEETKRKQWCAYCGKEAFFSCCWNTTYCDYPCQQAHWPTHSNNCTNN